MKTINHFFAGKIINEWDSIGKKKLPQVKVNKLEGTEQSRAEWNNFEQSRECLLDVAGSPRLSC